MPPTKESPSNFLVGIKVELELAFVVITFYRRYIVCVI